MKKTFLVFLSVLLFNSLSTAAPYYVGVGCNSEGKNCIFGKPSGRVLKWTQIGSPYELGTQCEKFLERIESRKSQIAQKRDLHLDYRNFTRGWSNLANPQAAPQIICQVELHSELPHVKLEAKHFRKFYWICDSENYPGFCNHSLDECKNARDESLKDSNVLDSAIYRSASLTQGSICTVVTARVK